MVQENCELASHCPATKAADLLGDKWVLLILRSMYVGACRYSDFTSAMPRISSSVLSGRLKQMCEHGLIVRRGDAGQQALYNLAPSGREAQPIVNALAAWGLKWAQRHTSVDQLDVGGAMWDLHRSIDVNELPDGENVIAFMLKDLEKHDRWWIVASRTEIDLCNIDPGKSVDVYINGSLQTLLDIWMGQRDLGHVMGEEELIITGNKPLVDTVRRWFPYAPPVRAMMRQSKRTATAQTQ